MNGNKAKLLRKGAKRLKLPYAILKKGFKSLNHPDKLKFLEEARLLP